MNPVYLFLVTALVVAQLVLPRKWAFLPLVIAGCQLGNAKILPEITPARLLMLIGLSRAVLGGFFVIPVRNRLDHLFLVFSGFALLSAVGHKPDEWFPSPIGERMGLVLNVLGAYLYGRAYLPGLEDFKRYAAVLPLILFPLFMGMAVEKQTSQNLYFIVGASSEQAAERGDRVRAQGPFRHPILAGSAGATALPFVYLLWSWGRKKTALAGLVACFGIVYASASSGPVAAVGVTAVGVGLWKWRQNLRYLLWSGLGLATLYWVARGRGPWYLMARIDLVGGSTGWHRAKLIDEGIEHLNEWWLFGTDYTRHWMSSGVRWNPNHIDLTNYYLHLGVMGGLPLALCLVFFLVTAFRMLWRRMAELRATGAAEELILGCAGMALAAHAVSFISISYFDQMYIFFYILLGAVPGLVAFGAPVAEDFQGRLEPSESPAAETVLQPAGGLV